MKKFDYSEHTTNSLQALYEELRNVAFDKIQWKETVG